MNKIEHTMIDRYQETNEIETLIDSFVNEINNPEVCELVDLISICEKYALKGMYNDASLLSIKAIFCSLFKAVDRIASENDLTQYDWDCFYFNLYNSLRLDEYFNEWKTGVFHLVDEVYEQDPTKCVHNKYLPMLLKLSTMKYVTSNDPDSLTVVLNQAPTIVKDTLFAYLQVTSYKEMVACIFLMFFSEYPDQQLSPEDVKSICQYPIETELSLSTFIHLIRCCSELESVEPFILEAITEKLLRVEKVSSESLFLFVALCVRKDQPKSWNEFHEKATLIMNKEIEDSETGKEVFDGITHELLIELSCFWRLQKENDCLSDIGHTNFSMVYMQWFHQLFLSMSTRQCT